MRRYAGALAAVVSATNLDVQSGGADLATQTTLSSIETSQATISNGVTSLANALGVAGGYFQATQQVSGTVTANAGTNLNTSALSLETTQYKPASAFIATPCHAV